MFFSYFFIQIGPARFRAPEVLFRPDLLGEECEGYYLELLSFHFNLILIMLISNLNIIGIHEVLMFAIQKSDMDLRKVLHQNIVLSGGSTLFRGFGDRLLAEIKRLAPKDMKIRVSLVGDSF